MAFILLKRKKAEEHESGAYRQGIRVSPVIDIRTGKIMIPKEQNDDFVISEDSSFLLEPLKLYDTSDPYIKYWLDTAGKLGVVAKNKEEFEKITTYKFYIYDEKVEVNSKISNVERRIDALIAVKNLSDTRKVEVLKVLGTNASVLSADIVLKMLYDYAETSPSKNAKVNWDLLLSAIDDRDYDVKLLYADLKFNNYITQRNARYYYNEMELGVSKEEVISFLKKEENYDVVSRLKELVYKPIEVVEIKKKGK